jgi:hypothetical protein
MAAISALLNGSIVTLFDLLAEQAAKNAHDKIMIKKW